MGITDDVKDLEVGYNYAKERICELLDEKIEYGETIRRLTIELNEKKIECNTLAESKKKLESMLDLCESSCSACKKPVEIENLKIILARRDESIETLNHEINAARLTILTLRDLQGGREYWHDRYQSHMVYCLSKCPYDPPRPYT